MPSAVSSRATYVCGASITVSGDAAEPVFLVLLAPLIQTRLMADIQLSKLDTDRGHVGLALVPVI